MSEKPDPNTPQPGPPPEERVVIALPDGRMVSAFELMNRHNEREASMNTRALRGGDVVAFRYDDEDGEQRGFTYEVEQAGWGSVGIGMKPSVSIHGTLQGSHLHPKVVGKEARFMGSSFGGSMIQTGTIATGRSPQFFFPGEGEYPAPFITDFEVFRPGDDDKLRPLEPNELDAEARKQLPEHSRRLKRIEELMGLFGFGDYRDFSREARETPNVTYEDGRYAAEYQSHGALGNLLGIYDKQTGQWTGFKYFSAGNEDILQIGYADLSGHKRGDVFDYLGLDTHIADTSSVHTSGEAIITYATSNRYGLEGINYMPSDRESVAMLGLSGDEHFIPDPNFQEVNGGGVQVERKWYLDNLDEKQPGLYDRLEQGARFRRGEDGVVTLELGDRVIPLKDPDAELDAIISNMENPGQARERGRAHRVGQAVGRLFGGP